MSATTSSILATRVSVGRKPGPGHGFSGGGRPRRRPSRSRGWRAPARAGPALRPSARGRRRANRGGRRRGRWGRRPGAGNGAGRPASDEEPEHAADQGQHDHHDEPQRLRQAPHTDALRECAVDERVDREDDDRDHDSHDQARHPVTVDQRGAGAAPENAPSHSRDSLCSARRRRGVAPILDGERTGEPAAGCTRLDRVHRAADPRVRGAPRRAVGLARISCSPQ